MELFFKINIIYHISILFISNYAIINSFNSGTHEK